MRGDMVVLVVVLLMLASPGMYATARRQYLALLRWQRRRRLDRLYREARQQERVKVGRADG